MRLLTSGHHNEGKGEPLERKQRSYHVFSYPLCFSLTCGPELAVHMDRFFYRLKINHNLGVIFFIAVAPS